MSFKNYKTLFFLLLMTHSLFAAFEPKGIGTAYLAAGSAGRAGTNRAFTVFLNPAKLVWNTDTGVRLFYKNYYGIENLNQMSLEARFPVWGQPFAIGINRYGISSYIESELRAGSAFRLFDALDLGFSANMYGVFLKNYGHSYAFGFTLAAVYKIFEHTQAAFTVENLNEPELGQAKEKIPLSAALGFSYFPVRNVEVLIDLVKEEDYDFDFRSGIAFKPLSWTTVRFGFKTIVKSYSAGFSINYGQFDLGYAFEYHTALGGSNSLSVGYVF
ncbi:hypothetical protein DRI50_10410 [candidate division KSB1 bacterium]|nr:MAG: hypothetical protein DRI50_10410 [candidate division KSB1 bacterium]